MSLERRLFGTTFRNPVLLAAGTCGFGEEVEAVVDLQALGGLVTKSVTQEPRWGNPAPRVAEVSGGMLNSIGLANPGVEQVRAVKLPWIRDNLGGLPVFVSIAGHTEEEFYHVVARLDDVDGFVGFELNLSCPNDARRDGLPFALDPTAVSTIVAGVRERTDRPVLAKLAPNDPDVGATTRRAEESGADGITLVNTLPALSHDRSGRPTLGAGGGGLSGPALLTVGVAAVARAAAATELPIVGVGGIRTGDDARQYLIAGARLVQIGTASFADPRAAERVVRELGRLPAGGAHA